MKGKFRMEVLVAGRAQEELREVLRINPKFDLEIVEAAAPYRNPADKEHLIKGQRMAGWEG